jgi:hypothetical protein
MACERQTLPYAGLQVICRVSTRNGVTRNGVITRNGVRNLFAALARRETVSGTYLPPLLGQVLPCVLVD